MTLPLRNRQLTTMRRRELMKVGKKVLKMRSMEPVKVKKVASSSAASVGNQSELVTICAHRKSV